MARGAVERRRRSRRAFAEHDGLPRDAAPWRLKWMSVGEDEAVAFLRGAVLSAMRCKRRFRRRRPR